MSVRTTERAPWRAVAFVVALAIGAAILHLPLRHAHRLAGPELTWWELLPAYLVAESLTVQVGLRRGTHTFTLAEVPLALGLALAAPDQLLMARVGAATILLVHRQRGLKLAYNLAMHALEVEVAEVVLRLIAPDLSVTRPEGWLAIVGATCVAGVVSSAGVSSIVALTQGTRAVPATVLLTGVLCVPPLAVLGVLCVVLAQERPWALLMLAPVLLALFVTQRGYATLTQQHQRLTQLYDFTRDSRRFGNSREVALETLRQCTRLLRASTALSLAQGPRGTFHLVRLVGDRLVVTAAEDEDPTLIGLLHDIARSGQGVLLPRGSGSLPAKALFAAAGVRDAVAVAVPLGPDRVSVLLVGNREDDVSSFTAEDQRLLGTIGAQSAVALRNADLLERLREEAKERTFQATHDVLTQLPNRRALTTSIEQALAEPRSQFAVLLLDLDEFKEINDTLGHQTGDLVLRAIGAHLRASLPPEFTVSRLGGDEFAVLCPDAGDPRVALAIGRDLQALFAHEFVVEGIHLVVRPSIGIAVAPQHGTDAVTLLQRADVAMYIAKETKTVMAVYNPASDPYTSERLELLAALRESLEQGTLDVHFQPKATLSDRRIVGAEALARWVHPVHGFVPPDVFVPLAETAGLMRPMTRHVLHVALQQCARWRRDDPGFTVAVNLSPHSLYEEHIVEDVTEALAAHGLPASALVLELTESTVMRDLNRGIETLNRLRDLGVELSVDDFGTGYSSLASLRRLPVQEVKIDKAFVLNAGEDPEDAAVVGMVVALGHQLGLRVCAEGVETVRAWDLLVALRCDHAQGYLLSRPLTVADFEQLLAVARTPATATVHESGGPALRLIA